MVRLAMQVRGSGYESALEEQKGAGYRFWVNCQHEILEAISLGKNVLFTISQIVTAPYRGDIPVCRSRQCDRKKSRVSLH